MEEKGLQIKVGLLVLLAIALLVGFVLVLGDFSVGKGFELDVTFTSSGDIASGGAVRLGGIRVGKVKELAFQESGEVDPKSGKPMVIRLRLWVEEKIRNLLRKDSEFYITARGVLGEKYVGITPGSASAGPLDLTKPIRGLDPPQTDLIAARLFDFIDHLSNLLRRDSHLIRRILQKGGDVMETVDTLLKENRGEVKTLISRARETAEKAGSLLDDVKPALADVRRLAARMRGELEDQGRVGAILDHVKGLTALVEKEAPGIIAKVKGLAEKAGGLADDGRGLVRDVRGIVGGEQQKIRKVIDTILAIGDKAKAAISLVHTLVSRIARGEGSVGALLKDDELYDNIREMVREIKQHPWKVLWKD
jgi:phospholipid/cholesterol/gamma-HCH transport system substrate-binding protein